MVERQLWRIEEHQRISSNVQILAGIKQTQFQWFCGVWLYVLVTTWEEIEEGTDWVSWVGPHNQVVPSQISVANSNPRNSFKELKEGEELILEASVLGPCSSTVLKHVFTIFLNNTTSQKNDCSEASNNTKGIQIHQFFGYLEDNCVVHISQLYLLLLKTYLSYPFVRTPASTHLCYMPSLSNKQCAPKAP